DMRGYPRGTGWELATRLPRRDSINAIFSRPIVEAVTLSMRDIGIQPSYSFRQLLSPTIDSPYTGRVVILIDENAQSQSEHLCLALESAHDVTFIGTPTAGANGDVTNVVLPGGITASFSGHDVRHADGRRLQRIGIQPDVRVEPTVRGLASGRDEVLEAAIEFLRTGRKP
ncbi:MAG TPA: S41 family peptidase, partial [Candidatus Kapabacteria bacterium]|nr:S41 family peptidase [Candidatus Kapabacteria bacterium]